MNRTHASASDQGNKPTSLAKKSPLAQHLVDNQWLIDNQWSKKGLGDQPWPWHPADPSATPGDLLLGDELPGLDQLVSPDPRAVPRGLTWAPIERELPEFSLFAPLHYERRYAYPLLVWLHSNGGTHQELRQVIPHVSLRNHVAVAVQAGASSTGGAAAAPPGADRCLLHRDRGERARTDRPPTAWHQQPDQVVDAATRVQQAIEIARTRYHIHPGRIFIAGYEGGGTMALRLGLLHPEWFAGAVSLEGPMPQGYRPLAYVNRARRLPLFMAACRDSDYFPWQQVDDNLRLLHSAGFALALRQYPGEHDLTTEMLADMNRWVLEQFC